MKFRRIQNSIVQGINVISQKQAVVVLQLQDILLQG